MSSHIRRTLRAFSFLILFCLSVSQSRGYALEGPTWATSSILIRLQFDPPAIALQDGSANWNDAAANALAIWNQQLPAMRFSWNVSPGSGIRGDGVNSAFFSNTVYGQSFGAHVLAVTLYKFTTSTQQMLEADTIFNTAYRFDSYRGPQQSDPNTGEPIIDFHRVAIHEFGHTLGLDHPDDHGQSVTAIMNSIISDLDGLADDDMAGARFLYPGKIYSVLTYSVAVGDFFYYQIGATNNPVSFEASPLPDGLKLDSKLGWITGNPAALGTFAVTLVAHGPKSDVSATLQITVTGPRITSSTAPPSVDIGANFTYRITATSGATSFSATGLPPGMTIDTASGLISGVPTLSGSYVVAIIAHTPFGDASSSANFVVQALGTPEIPVATFPFYPSNPTLMVADPHRPRVYIWTAGALAVIDTTSLTVIKKITIPHPASDLSLSADGNKMWIAYGSYDSSHMLGSVDLETLTALPELALSFQPQRIREGLNGRLYVTDPTGSVIQVDSVNGGAQGPFSTAQFGSFIEISPDRRTLYVGDYALGPNGSGSYLSRFDVSASAPTLLQRANQFGSGGRALTISHNGQFVFFQTVSGTSAVAASDLTKVYGTIPPGGSGIPSPLALSPDDAQGFQINAYSSKIGVYNPANCQMLRAIDIGATSYDSNLLVDRSNSYLFFSGLRSYGPSQLELFRLGPPPLPSTPKTLLNVSTRLRAQAGDNALIGGFIISGQETKKVVLRAIGPSLPVSGKLADPVLELHDATGAIVGQNDNWNAHRADVLATGIAPGDEHEAVIVISLQPGSFTAVLRGLNDSSGVALVEVYDLSPHSNSKLANISTRGKVEAGDNVMIGGFIIGGDQPTNVIVRAIGPSLTRSNVPGALTDPTLEVYDGNGTLHAQDDDWRMYQEELLTDSGLAPTDDRESAMFLQLQPGNYTAIVRGKDNSTGVGLVEVYNLDSN